MIKQTVLNDERRLIFVLWVVEAVRLVSYVHLSFFSSLLLLYSI